MCVVQFKKKENVLEGMEEGFCFLMLYVPAKKRGGGVRTNYGTVRKVNRVKLI